MAECTSEVFIAFLYTHYGFINGWVYIWSVHCLSIHTLWFYKWLSVHLKCSLTLYTHILVFYMAECTSEVFIDFLYTHYGFINGWVYIWSVHWLSIHTLWFYKWLSVHLKCSLTFYTHIMVFYMAECTSEVFIDFLYTHYGFINGWVYIWSVHWLSIHTLWFYKWLSVHLKCSLTFYTHILVL